MNIPRRREAAGKGADLLALTGAALKRHAPGPLLAGFSGGHDSSALLDVLARLPDARRRGLRAIHVHHGLHADADAWAAHCRRFCSARAIPLQVARVRVQSGGTGPEDAARRARLAAFAAELQAGETLVLAHHRDDQAETILLKLLRGAGPHGLAGMRPRRPFAAGTLWRPWINTPRAQLQAWIDTHALDWIRDPANADPGMSRSWLRREIMPRLAAHLPQAAASIVHAGRLCAATRDHLDAEVATRLPALRRGATLDAAAWLAQPAALRTLLLERWLHDQGLRAPDQRQQQELERQAAGIRDGRAGHLHWDGTDVRIWRGALHAAAPLPALDPHWEAAWDGRPLRLPLGELRLTAAAAAPLPQALHVRLRRGGEYLHRAGDPCGRELRYIFQQAGLPPWLRGRCPLIYRDAELLAVGDLAQTAAGAEFFATLGAQPEWRYHVGPAHHADVP